MAPTHPPTSPKATRCRYFGALWIIDGRCRDGGQARGVTANGWLWLTAFPRVLTFSVGHQSIPLLLTGNTSRRKRACKRRPALYWTINLLTQSSVQKNKNHHHQQLVNYLAKSGKHYATREDEVNSAVFNHYELDRQCSEERQELGGECISPFHGKLNWNKMLKQIWVCISAMCHKVSRQQRSWRLQIQFIDFFFQINFHQDFLKTKNKEKQTSFLKLDFPATTRRRPQFKSIRQRIHSTQHRRA